VVREPLETRPLSLKNTDNKTIVQANVLMLEPQYKKNTHKVQNGFVSGRSFLQNLVDIDAAGRIYSSKYQGSMPSLKITKNIPVIGAYDFKPHFRLLSTGGFGQCSNTGNSHCISLLYLLPFIIMPKL